ncbi:MAG TPA: hypothetical protein PK299_15320 [Anaerolineales bacterium]|nr:hypothetical protein [Anaerolineales bacterium]
MPNIDIVFIHSRLFTTCWWFSLGMGIWSIWLFLQRRDMGADFLGALVICQVLMTAQLLFTLVLYLTGIIEPHRWVYFLYNIMMGLTIPALFAYTKGQTTHRETLLYGLTLVFLWGIVWRAMLTA